jgi:hypothetical protein
VQGDEQACCAVSDRSHAHRKSACRVAAAARQAAPSRSECGKPLLWQLSITSTNASAITHPRQ